MKQKNDKNQSTPKDQPRIDSFFGLARESPAKKNLQYKEGTTFTSKNDTFNSNYQKQPVSRLPDDLILEDGPGNSMDLERVLNNLNGGYETSKTIELDNEEVNEIISGNNKNQSKPKKESPMLEEYNDEPKIQRGTSIYQEKKTILALPNHIPQIWKAVQPKLQKIKSGAVQTIDEFLEIISDFIRLHYERKIHQVNLGVLILLLESFDSNEVNYFFDALLPFMANLALRIEYLFKGQPIKILSQNCENYTDVTLTKEQVACLVAHMFFCTIHKQNNRELPQDCNFSFLYRDSRRNDLRLEKLKCFYNYFKRMQCSIPNYNITYQRLVLDITLQGNIDEKFWESCKDPLSKVIVVDDGGIEERVGAIQVDFANKYLGGGVLDSGCVQEEIRFAVSPELLVAMLFTERMLDHEAVIVMGAEQYSKYSGYADTFKFEGDFKDNADVDLYNRKDVTILAIDAIDFSRTSTNQTQYKMSQMLRELNKAYIGFCGSDQESQETGTRKEIASGRWGCGNFLGDPQLKFILQWIAASKTNRDLVFYRFKDASLKDMERVVKRFKDSNIAELFEQLKFYNQMLFVDKVEMSLFEYFLDVV